MASNVEGREFQASIAFCICIWQGSKAPCEQSCTSNHVRDHRKRAHVRTSSSRPRLEHSLENPSASHGRPGQCYPAKHHAMLHLSQLPLYGRTPTVSVALRSPLFRSWSRIAERHSCAVSFSSCPCVHILRAVGVMLAIARRNDRYA